MFRVCVLCQLLLPHRCLEHLHAFDAFELWCTGTRPIPHQMDTMQAETNTPFKDFSKPKGNKRSWMDCETERQTDRKTERKKDVREREKGGNIFMWHACVQTYRLALPAAPPPPSLLAAARLAASFRARSFLHAFDPFPILSG